MRSAEIIEPASSRRSRTIRAGAGCSRRASSRRARWTTSRSARRTCSSATPSRLQRSRSRSATSALRLDDDATIAVCGADGALTVDGERDRALGEPPPAGGRRASRSASRPGPASGSTSRSTAASTCRCSSAPVRPTRWARSAASTAGRCRQGDRLPLGSRPDGAATAAVSAAKRGRPYSREWEVRAMRGPQAAPDYLTEGDMADAVRPGMAGRPQLEPHRRPSGVA